MTFAVKRHSMFSQIGWLKHEGTPSLLSPLVDFRNRYGRDALILLVGNKIDRAGEREVSRDEAMALARKYNIDYTETSAKTGEGVFQAFEMLTKSATSTNDPI